MDNKINLVNIHYHTLLQFFFLWWRLIRSTDLATFKCTVQFWSLYSPCSTLISPGIIHNGEFVLLTTFSHFHLHSALGTNSLPLDLCLFVCLFLKIRCINKIIFVFSLMTYFTLKKDAFKKHPCGLKWQNFLFMAK